MLTSLAACSGSRDASASTHEPRVGSGRKGDSGGRVGIRALGPDRHERRDEAVKGEDRREEDDPAGQEAAHVRQDRAGHPAEGKGHGVGVEELLEQRPEEDEQMGRWGEAAHTPWRRCEPLLSEGCVR